MSPGVMSSSASASAAERLTTRQSLSIWSGPPTPVPTSTAPPGWVTTKPCTGHCVPSSPRSFASCSRLTSSAIGDRLPDVCPRAICQRAPHRRSLRASRSNRDMCTAIVSVDPAGPLLLAGVRDELVDRAWQPPGRHWPDHPGLIGGRDLQAGGTWLAVAPAANRVACVLNGRGRMAPEGSRRSRGVLPLEVAGHGKLERADLTDFDPFHLLSAEPGTAAWWSWDGEHLT